MSVFASLQVHVEGRQVMSGAFEVSSKPTREKRQPRGRLMQLLEQSCAEVLVHKCDVTPHMLKDPGCRGQLCSDFFGAFVHAQKSLEIRNSEWSLR